MGRVRQRDTAPELALRRELWRRGFRYRLHPKLPGHPDIAFSGPKLAVFVDGCFWHGCPLHGTMPKRNKEFWASKIARNIERDAEIDDKIAALGWQVVHVWEHEIKEDVGEVSSRIENRVRKETG